MSNRFFVEPDGLSGPELWLRTDDDRYPLVLRKAELPGPYDELLWRVVTGVLAPDDATVERLCEAQHDAYEAAAVEAGWETQQRSRKPWAEVPEANKQTMRASVRAVLAALADPDTGGDPS